MKGSGTLGVNLNGMNDLLYSSLYPTDTSLMHPEIPGYIRGVLCVAGFDKQIFVDRNFKIMLVLLSLRW